MCDEIYYLHIRTNKQTNKQTKGREKEKGPEGGRRGHSPFRSEYYSHASRVMYVAGTVYMSKYVIN